MELRTVKPQTCSYIHFLRLTHILQVLNNIRQMACSAYFKMIYLQLTAIYGKDATVFFLLDHMRHSL